MVLRIQILWGLFKDWDEEVQNYIEVVNNKTVSLHITDAIIWRGIHQAAILWRRFYSVLEGDLQDAAPKKTSLEKYCAFKFWFFRLEGMIKKGPYNKSVLK